MVGWYNRLNGFEFEQAPGVVDGQGGLACCSPLVAKCHTRLSDNHNRELDPHATTKTQCSQIKKNKSNNKY